MEHSLEERDPGRFQHNGHDLLRERVDASDGVLSGQAVARMDDGSERLMKAGDFFYVPPGHDSWVVGDEPYVSLHILGSEGYAAPSGTR